MKHLFKKIVTTLLWLEARAVLSLYRPKIVAITGSVGKTSTKDTIYTVLASRMTVRKSSKSFNSDIGVPLTILNLPNGWSNPVLWLTNIWKGLMLIVIRQPYPEWLVLEVGADHPGDIQRITEYVRPDIAVITRLPRVPVHVEFFSSPEQVQQEKAYLARRITAGGTLILNSDDTLVMELGALPHGKKVTFGTHFSSTVRAFGLEIEYINDEHRHAPLGTRFDVVVGKEQGTVVTEGTVGFHMMYPFAAAIAVGVSLDMSLAECIDALKDHAPPQGRMRVLPGIRDTVIIDDTYNSSPIALKEALTTLGQIETPNRRIAVLGDMLELGEYSPEEHRKAGVFASKIADVLVTVGVRARGLAQAAQDAGANAKQVFEFLDSREAGAFVRQFIEPGDTVLMKGSQSTRMERATAMLVSEPELAQQVLVRQETEWKKK